MNRGRTSEIKEGFFFFPLFSRNILHLKIKYFFLLGRKVEQCWEAAAPVSTWDVPGPGKLQPQPSLSTVLQDAGFSHDNPRQALARLRQMVGYSHSVGLLGQHQSFSLKSFSLKKGGKDNSFLTFLMISNSIETSYFVITACYRLQAEHSWQNWDKQE